MDIHIKSITGDQILEWIPEIAKLRIQIFAEYPFLYDGDLDYEKQYLQKFTTMKEGIVVVAFAGDQLVGIATGFPLVFDTDEIKSVINNPEDYYCFGESVLLKEYRGKGIGKAFFEKRLEYVLSLNSYKAICFYTIVKSVDDPARPADYKSPERIWEKRGYVKHPELTTSITYKAIGEETESPKKMVFWIKEL